MLMGWFKCSNCRLYFIALITNFFEEYDGVIVLTTFRSVRTNSLIDSNPLTNGIICPVSMYTDCSSRVNLFKLKLKSM